MSFDGPDEPFLDVLQNIEVILKDNYEKDAAFTDSMATRIIDMVKILIKKKHGYGLTRLCEVPSGSQDVVNALVEIGEERIGKINDLTLEHFCRCLDKVGRSIERRRQTGVRGYYEFIRKYV
jgi:hypothetical protein